MTFVRLQPIAVLEASLYAYLLTIPFGPAIAPFARHAILVALVVSMGLVHFLPAAPSGRPAAYGLLPFFLLLAVSHGLSILFSSNPSLSLASSTYAPVAALIFFATQDVVTTPPAFRRISIVLTATVLLVGIDGAWQALTDHSFLTG